MNRLTLPAAPPGEPRMPCRPAELYVAGRLRGDLLVRTWELLTGPPFARATLEARREPDGTGPRFEDIHVLPPLGTEVLVRPAPGSGGGELPGVVVRHIAEAGPDGERVVADVEHRLAATLAKPPRGRVVLADGKPTPQANAAPAFNAGPAGRASAEAVELNGRACRVFSDAPDAVRWTVADALAYLLAAHVPADVSVPSPQRLASLLDADLDLGTYAPGSACIADALEQVASRGGLCLRATRMGLGLEVFPPGRRGRVIAPRLQSAGQTFDRGRTNLHRGRIVLRPRGSRRGVLAIGAAKRYEATFELLGGWDPSAATDRWRDSIRSRSDDWHVLRDVYRLWVLNEHGRYAQPPWSLPAWDPAMLNQADFFLRRARRFLPCLSRNAGGKPLGVVIEVRCGEGAAWRRWSQPAWVADDQCAVWLGGDALPADFFRAAVAGDAAVRVTAVLEADARLTVELPGDPRLPRRITDLCDRAAYRQVHQSSIFAGAAGTGEPDTCDDTPLLTRAARQLAEDPAGGVQARLTLGWIDTFPAPGDLVPRVEGRGLDLGTAAGAVAWVRRVGHDFTDAQTTTLDLEA